MTKRYRSQILDNFLPPKFYIFFHLLKVIKKMILKKKFNRYVLSFNLNTISIIIALQVWTVKM